MVYYVRRFVYDIYMGYKTPPWDDRRNKCYQGPFSNFFKENMFKYILEDFGYKDIDLQDFLSSKYEEVQLRDELFNSDYRFPYMSLFFKNPINYVELEKFIGGLNKKLKYKVALLTPLYLFKDVTYIMLQPESFDWHDMSCIFYYNGAFFEDLKKYKNYFKKYGAKKGMIYGITLEGDSYEVE